MGESVEVHMLYDLLISPRVIYFVPRVAKVATLCVATLAYIMPLPYVLLISGRGNRRFLRQSMAMRGLAYIEPYSRPSTLQVRENLALYRLRFA
jgi:hypothetical protein